MQLAMLSHGHQTQSCTGACRGAVSYLVDGSLTQRNYDAQICVVYAQFFIDGMPAEQISEKECMLAFVMEHVGLACAQHEVFTHLLGNMQPCNDLASIMRATTSRYRNLLQ